MDINFEDTDNLSINSFLSASEESIQIPTRIYNIL